MSETQDRSFWAAGEYYEGYIGRWGRLIAREFSQWLAMPAGLRWVDVGCGTGALTQAILSQADPREIRGVDPSEGFLTVARRQVVDPRVRFDVGNAAELPLPSGEFDGVVSGLILNFVPDLDSAMTEMRRVAKPGATIAAYVWDYAGKMEVMRYFWDEVVALWPHDRQRDEGVRSPICNPGPLQELYERNGLHTVEVRAIDVPTHFRDFDEYWKPFLEGQFPAPRYAMSLSETDRATLRERIRAALPIEADGSIRLIARAWAVRGTV